MQSHAIRSVNPTIEFLRIFGPSAKFFIYCLHRDYNPTTGLPTRYKPRSNYGTVEELSEWLGDHVHKLNSEKNRFEIYYAVNDPGQGKHLYPSDISSLRAIYQDCDNVDLGAIDQRIAGQSAHAVVSTSPGKFQRIWLTEPINPFRAESIHGFMVARHAHDSSTKGTSRLLRLPGYRNWKYQDGPLVTLHSSSELPILSEEAVNDHFGFRILDGNINRLAQNIQRSGDMPSSAVGGVTRLPARGSAVKDADNDRQHREHDAKGTTQGQVPLSDVLNVLALLNPDCPRNEWWSTIAALHLMSAGEPWGKDTAEAWSRQAPKRFQQETFDREWEGFGKRAERGLAQGRVTCWETLQNRTRMMRHDRASRQRRLALEPLIALHGDTVTYAAHDYTYPILTRTGGADGDVWRPDPNARRNFEYLLSIEGLTAYRDTFASTDVLEDAEGNRIPFDRDALVRLFSRAHTTGLRASKQQIVDHVEAIAIGQGRDPVRIYLESLPEWDGVERLKHAPTRYLGADDTPANRLFLELLLRAAIRRTFKPGAKFDLMWILEGKQGLGKSRFFRELLPDDEWFSDSLRINDESKRLYQQIGGKLIVEFAELAGMSKADTNNVKKLITQQVDEYIPNYGIKPVRAPRRCVFVGTVNGNSYLRDTTGNRRFPIVECKRRLNVDALKADRDQLWAEALSLARLWNEEDVLELPADVQKQMDIIQESRMDVNTESGTIIEEIKKFKEGYFTTETLWARMGLKHSERAKRTGHMQYMIKEIRESIERHGWQWNEPTKIDGRTQRVIIKKLGNTRKAPPEIIASPRELTYAHAVPASSANVDEPSIEELLS